MLQFKFQEIFNITLTILIIFVLRKLKRKQALLRSNLPAIDFLRYAVTLWGWDVCLVSFLFVTDIALWLRKPKQSFCHNLI